MYQTLSQLLVRLLHWLKNRYNPILETRPIGWFKIFSWNYQVLGDFKATLARITHISEFFCHLRNSTSSPLMYSVSNSLFHWGGISSLIIFLFLLSVVVYVMYSSLAGNKCSDYTTEFHLKMIDPYLMKMAWPVSSSVCSHSVLLESSLSHQVLHPTSGNFPTNDYKLLSH